MKKLLTVRDVPLDEMLLALALQEANARGLGPTMGDMFIDANGDPVRWNSKKIRWCCAAGALVLARVGKFGKVNFGFVMPAFSPLELEAIVHGNDDSHSDYSENLEDKGETIGHAFQLAMEGYGESWVVQACDL